jgi:hypothetical protein
MEKSQIELYVVNRKLAPERTLMEEGIEDEMKLIVKLLMYIL